MRGLIIYFLDDWKIIRIYDDSNEEQEKLVKDTPKRPTPINVSIVSLLKGNVTSTKGTKSYNYLHDA
jgi:hypothetical protein